MINNEKLKALNALLIVIGTLIGIVQSLSSPRPTTVEATNSNVAIGNSAPVIQNLNVNELPDPKPGLIITHPSSQDDTGMYHAQVLIGIGITPGTPEPKLNTFNPSRGVLVVVHQSI